jgi:hypothetical protein
MIAYSPSTVKAEMSATSTGNFTEQSLLFNLEMASS